MWVKIGGERGGDAVMGGGMPASTTIMYTTHLLHHKHPCLPFRGFKSLMLKLCVEKESQILLVVDVVVVQFRQVHHKNKTRCSGETFYDDWNL